MQGGGYDRSFQKLSDTQWYSGVHNVVRLSAGRCHELTICSQARNLSRPIGRLKHDFMDRWDHNPESPLPSESFHSLSHMIRIAILEVCLRSFHTLLMLPYSEHRDSSVITSTVPI